MLDIYLYYCNLLILLGVLDKLRIYFFFCVFFLEFWVFNIRSLEENKKKRYMRFKYNNYGL